MSSGRWSVVRVRGAKMVGGGLVAGGWWLVAGGWWLVAGGLWLVAGGWTHQHVQLLVAQLERRGALSREVVLELEELVPKAGGR